METIIDKKRRSFRGQMIREFLVTSLIDIAMCCLVWYAKDLSFLETTFLFLSGMTFTLWNNWFHKCAAFCPLSVEFQEEGIRMTVINVFKEREIILRPNEISIEFFAFETKDKSCILLYTKPKRKGGYRMRNPVWSYEEQTVILEKFSEYKEIPIRIQPVYR